MNKVKKIWWNKGKLVMLNPERQYSAMLPAKTSSIERRVGTLRVITASIGACRFLNHLSDTKAMLKRMDNITQPRIKRGLSR